MRGDHHCGRTIFQHHDAASGGLLILCRWIIRIAWALYLVALALLLIGTFGLFGQERDPLAGVFLMPLGLPWVIWLDAMPDPLLPWLAASAPLLNLVLLMMLCRIFAGRNSS